MIQVRKGDLRKAAIIDAAEELFYRKGYENTSVQDVLDELQLSKGGFYHHFESKLSLLDAICEKRVDGYAENCRKNIMEHGYKGIDKLNAVLASSTYFTDSSIEFISIMLDVAYRQEAVMLRDHMAMATREVMTSLITEAISEGMDENLFFTKYARDMGGIILRLSCELTDDISFIAVRTPSKSERDYEIMGKINAYTYACETLLNAPRGSIKLQSSDVCSVIDTSLN